MCWLTELFTLLQINNPVEGFRNFLKGGDGDVAKTLAKVPLAHAELIKGYKIRWESGNTLKGDGQHIGVINPKTRTITIASPWYYGREFTLLHELGHKVWEKFVDEGMRKEWQRIVRRTKDKLPQNDEELFSMAYSNFFVKNKIAVHDHPEWGRFVEKVIKKT